MTETAAAIVEPIEFTCKEGDFLDAQRLHHTLSLKGRRFLVVIAVGAIVVVCASMIGRHSIDGLALLDGLASAVLFLCLMAILITLSRLLLLPRAARRQFLQQKEFKGSMKVAINSPRIALTSTIGFSDTPTEDFLKWAENGKSILLYRSDRLFNFVPKRVMSEAFHRSLLAELTRAGVLKAGFSNS